MGCHGGAGVSTLAAVGIGRDSGMRWPQGLVTFPAGIVLVARLSASGMQAASRAAEAWQSNRFPQGTVLLGLVAVAAGPKRAPKLARDRLELVAGWCPQVWEVPWVGDLLGLDPENIAEHSRLCAAIPRELFTAISGRQT